MLKITKMLTVALAVSACLSVAHAETIVYTSDSSVTAYDEILPAAANSNWPTEVCKVNPDVTLNDNWVNPHPAFEFGTSAHPWQPGAGLNAQWINAWSDLNSRGPGGHNWTRYSTPISGNGNFVLNLLADNCSWIYIDGQLVGFQGPVSFPSSYPVTLDGDHTLDFLIFDGGGLAGGMFRLETNVNVVFEDTDNDGLTDAEEVLTETDPTNPDSDGDGFLDGEEVAAGTDPNDASDFPVTDADGDGVNDSGDQCVDTAAGASVDQFGCSGEQNIANLCACEGPTEGQSWKNHGEYVSCVAHAKNDQVNMGLLTEAEGGAIVSAAGQSSCGKPAKAKGKGKK